MRLVSLSRLLPLILVAPLAAQLTTLEQAEFDGPAYNSAVSTGGPNLLIAYHLQAVSTYTCSRLEVFTGNQRGSNSLAIWTHDTVNNRPGVQLGVGSWEMSRLVGWQGAVLGTPVPLTQGQDFWVVWGCQNGSQSPIQGTGAGAQPYRGSFDGGQTWNGPFQSYQWKIRLYSGLFPGAYECFGSGCGGTGRTIPELGWDGQPLLGTSMNVRLLGVPSSFALLTIGLSNTVHGTTPLPLDLTFVGAPGCFLRTSLGASAWTVTDANGNGSVALAFPNSGALIGQHFYDQWLVASSGVNALGFIVSNGGEGEIGL